MAFPTTGILDDFTRADGDPGANWNGPSDGNASKLTIVSNQLTSAAAGFGAEGWTTSHGPDVEAYFTVATLPAGAAAIYFVVRATSVTAATINGYYLKLIAANNDWILFREDAGAGTQLASNLAEAMSAGDSVGLEMVGPVLTAYHKPAAGSWTSVVTTSDATYTAAGFSILELPDNTIRVDNFGGGSVVTAGPVPVSQPSTPHFIGVM